ncbi:uncharacterized protein LOC117340809 [Pecten maximus]|uniref:uncharacterized protein LOC117340809 n=1 Tax=Pecten maximus TaxID=6579 RepID=UPI0014587ED1|nr:uncharacterized protein LOC117340809 [Pecten maximus]
MNMYPGAAQLPTGLHGISAAAFDRQGNAAVCTYRLYIKRSNCRSLDLPNRFQENPVGGQTMCSPDGSNCLLKCNNPTNSQSGQAQPSTAAPYIVNMMKMTGWNHSFIPPVLMLFYKDTM